MLKYILFCVATVFFIIQQSFLHISLTRSDEKIWVNLVIIFGILATVCFLSYIVSFFMLVL